MDIPDAFPSEICQKFKLDTETIELVVETGMNVLTEQKYTCDDDEISYIFSPSDIRNSYNIILKYRNHDLDKF